MVIFHTDVPPGPVDLELMGGKAAGLVGLQRAGAEVPPWFVLPPGQDPSLALRAWAETGWKRVAVRSSAVSEDGADHSFAGMYESVLGVSDLESLRKAIARCRASASSDRIRAYLQTHGLPSSPVAVIIQDMVEGDASGVMFTRDPTDPDRTLISAAWGLGEGVVQGSVPCDTYRVDGGGEIEAWLADKDTAISLVDGAPAPVPVPSGMAEEATLSDAQARALAETGRRLEAALGGPQDVEWTRCGDRLVWLQARPVTQPVPTGRRLLWDNANIIESYHGLTGPLTYSFAARAYTIVYQLFCEVMGVPEATIRENAGVFSRMIGLIRGRIFYNLDAWYRVVSLLPGYQWNRDFLEKMMGVSDVADPEDQPQGSGRLADLLRLLRLVCGLLWRQARLDKDVARFSGEFELAMVAHERNLAGREAHELVEIYGDLERRLLWAWSTPIVNDFFVMIFHGLLGRLCEKWLAEEPGLHNALLAGEGGLMSAAPAVEALRLARDIRERAEWRVLLESPLSNEEVYHRSSDTPALRSALDDYLEAYGDRCVDELKLETPSLRDEPGRFIGTLRAYLALPQPISQTVGVQERAMRLDAEARARAGLSLIRGPIFRWVLTQTRKRVRDRENLRFLRTRIFGRVRDIFVALGRHMAAAGAVENPRDVFWLTTDEVFGWVRGTTVTTRMGALVDLRRAEYAEWADAAVPADRFQTWGPVWADNLFIGRPAPPSSNGLSGLSAFPGVVEGTVRRVTDPDDAGAVDGAVVVAYRTDPGWVPLFPRLSALVVERGSLLSHSAVVARELGIPTVVAVAGVMDTLRDGDRVRVDATVGEITLLERPG